MKIFGKKTKRGGVVLTHAEEIYLLKAEVDLLINKLKRKGVI